MKHVKNEFGLRLLSIGDVATLLGVSTFSIRSALERGAFPPPIQMNLSKRWAVSTIRDFSEGRWRPEQTTTDLPDENEAA